MLKIRLKRTGRKSNPFYRIVLMENLSRRNGKAIEELGYYDPIRKLMNFDKEKIHKYIKYMIKT
jgi:small subunit ribosomal protein S16